MNKKKIIAIALAIILIVIGSKTSSLKSQISGLDKLDSFNRMFSEANETVLVDGDSENKIVKLNYYGVIQGDSYYQKFMNNLELIRNDDNVVGVILEINSPGGGVYESQEIKDKITQIKSEKEIPFYVSMNSMAASGGYYIAAPCDKIYASQETITGSIGVIMATLNFSGLFEKYGVSYDVIKSGALKDMASGYKKLSNEERVILQELIDTSYQRFVKVVSDGRKMSVEEVKKLADGRIYDGEQALKVKLIDEIGYYEKALQDLTTAVNVENPQVITYEYLDDEFSSIFSMKANLENFSKSSIEKDFSAIKGLRDHYSLRPMYLYGGI